MSVGQRRRYSLRAGANKNEPSRRELEIGDHLDEDLAERRHHVGRIVQGEPADDANGELSVGEDDVVESNEEQAHVLGLCEVAVELVGELLEDGLSNAGLCEYQQKGAESAPRSIREERPRKTDLDRRCLRSGASRAPR